VGYRVRARLHVRDGAAGFFREGTHTLCSAASTGQLRAETGDAVGAVLSALGDARQRCDAVIVSENVEGDERLIHLEMLDGSLPREPVTTAAVNGVTGLTTRAGETVVPLWGASTVTDRASALFGAVLPDGVAAEVCWRRGPLSFFQGNRFLTGILAAHVIASVRGDRVADCYSGVGLFAIPLAARGVFVTAIEADVHAAADLASNSRPYEGRVDARRETTERALAALTPRTIDTVIVDPPRTGLSADVSASLGRLAPATIVYVSCDPATLARDTARLSLLGYRLADLRAFDLFPNTAHVESVALFGRATGN
jgi:23S rRNA (uracil1939-C5)-methyltransferase